LKSSYFEIVGASTNLLSTHNHKTDLINLCFIFTSFLDYGGVENWFWSLNELLTKKPYRIHMVKVLGDWSSLIPLIFKNMKIEFNPDILRMQVECDINIITGSYPINRLTSSEVQLLVIHGGSGCSWTDEYSRFHKHYDTIIAVSPDSGIPVSASGGAYEFIPTIVLYDDTTCEYEPPCLKSILFLGRISHEKNPILFCEVINNLPIDYCGWMIGPMYINDTSLCELRTRIDPPTKHPQCVIRKSFIVVNTSFKEGGPIVAIESWINDKAYVMFKTGLGIMMDDSSTFSDDDPKQMANLLLNLNVSQCVINNRRILNKYFDPGGIMQNWDRLLLNNYNRVNVVRPLNISYNDGGYYVEHGKSRSLHCYRYCVFGGNIIRDQFYFDMIVFEYIINSKYESSDLIFEVKVDESWVSTKKPINQRVDSTTIKLSHPVKSVRWRVIMSQVVLVLYEIKLSIW